MRLEKHKDSKEKKTDSFHFILSISFANKLESSFLLKHKLWIPFLTRDPKDTFRRIFWSTTFLNALFRRVRDRISQTTMHGLGFRIRCVRFRTSWVRNQTIFPALDAFRRMGSCRVTFKPKLTTQRMRSFSRRMYPTPICESTTLP